MPAKKGKKPEDKFPLKMTVKQRDSLVGATRLTTGIKLRIKEASYERQFVEFTKKELGRIAEEVYTSLAYAPPADRKQLNAVLDNIDDLLDDLEEKDLNEKRQAIHKSGAIFQFKVTLKEIEPPIWRRIQLPDLTLDELHEVLQVVMGWEDCYLHQFIIRGEYYGPLDPEDTFWDMEKHDEEEMSISKIVKMARKVRFTYEYDFGDSWQHEIVLEKTMEPEQDVIYPRCIEGQGHAHRRTWAGSGATPSSSKPSRTRSTRATGT